MADHFGSIANVAQLTGIDAVRLIGMIVQAASTARLHKKSCRQFAQYLNLIGNLLKPLKMSELKKYPETREPLEQLEDALRRSYYLINSFQDRSYFYLLAMGGSIVNQFKTAQREITGFLNILHLITLVDNARLRRKIDYILKQQYEYTLDDEDKKVQDLIYKHDPTKNDSAILKKSLSCSYPNLPMNVAIQKELQKLQVELQRSQADLSAAQVIQHLIEVTKSMAADSSNSSGVSQKQHHDESYTIRNETVSTPRNTSILSEHEWHSDLLGCFSEPLLCLKAHFFPCGTFSRIATVANNRPTSSSKACQELMAYSLICSCCCYTSCIRRKVRRMMNITGGWFDDFLSHLMCCCCALVQEERELEIRGVYGPTKTKTSHPTSQHMTPK